MSLTAPIGEPWPYNQGNYVGIAPQSTVQGPSTTVTTWNPPLKTDMERRLETLMETNQRLVEIVDRLTRLLADKETNP